MLMLSLLGLFVGLLMGLTGAGGGILAVPLLVFLTGMTVTTAAPIALTAVFMAAAIGAIAGHAQGMLRYRAAAVMALLGVVLAPVGLWVAHQLDNRLLMAVFAVLLLIVAVESLQQKKQPQAEDNIRCLLDPDTGRLRWTSRCSLSLVSAGAVAGFLSGLVGVGGGFVIVPALGRLSNLSIQAVIPTSLGVIALVSLSSLGSALWWGSLEISSAIPFVIGAVVGMIAGRRLTAYLAVPTMKKMFAVVAVVVAVMMIVRAVG